MYFDKNGNEIRVGMILVHDQGEEWEVCETVSSETEQPDLGLSCSGCEAYPLWQFDMHEWEIKSA